MQPACRRCERWSLAEEPIRPGGRILSSRARVSVRDGGHPPPFSPSLSSSRLLLPRADVPPWAFQTWGGAIINFPVLSFTRLRLTDRVPISRSTSCHRIANSSDRRSPVRIAIKKTGWYTLPQATSGNFCTPSQSRVCDSLRCGLGGSTASATLRPRIPILTPQRRT